MATIDNSPTCSKWESCTRYPIHCRECIRYWKLRTSDLYKKRKPNEQKGFRLYVTGKKGSE